MKCFYLFVLLLLGVALSIVSAEDITKPKDEENDIYTFSDGDIKEITDKCRDAGGEAAVKNFKVALQRTMSCLKNSAPKNQQELTLDFSPAGDEKNLKLCTHRYKGIRECFVDLLPAVKDCLDEEEKYAPEFFFDAFDNLLNFICHDNAKIFIDAFESNNTWNCVTHLANEKVGNMSYQCLDNIKLLNANDDNIFSKPELCEDLYNAKVCLTQFLKQECPIANEMYEFFVGIFDAVSSPCKSSKTKRHLANYIL